MKKAISLLLAVIMLVSTFAMTGVSAFANTLSNPYDAAFGTSYTKYVGYDTDVVYRFYAPTSGAIKMTATTTQDHSVYANYYNSNNELCDYEGIYWDSNRGHGYLDTTIYVPQGYFYIKFDTSYDNTLTFSTSFVSSNETFPETLNDNDNVAPRARGIELNATYYGQLGFDDGVDFYALYIPYDMDVTINFVSYLTGTLYFDLFDGNVNSIDYWGVYQDNNLGYGTRSLTRSFAAGLYYIKVNSSNRVGFYSFNCMYYPPAPVYTPAPAPAPAPEYYTVAKPPKTSIKSVKSSKKKAVTVKWNYAYSTNYQVQLATDSKFKKNKKTVNVDGSKLSKTVTGLKSGKKYYVRVRAYNSANGVKAYSGWSKVKTVKVK